MAQNWRYVQILDVLSNLLKVKSATNVLQQYK